MGLFPLGLGPRAYMGLGISVPYKSLSSFGHILASAKSLTDVSCITFSHTRRIGNTVAHNLAKHARHVIGFKVWMKDVPLHLHSVLFADYG